MSPLSRPRLIVDSGLGTALGDLAAVSVGPVEQLLYQLARFPRRPVGLARGGERRLCFGQRSVSMVACPIDTRGDPVGEPLTEPLPVGGLRGGLDAHGGDGLPVCAQIVARRSELGLEPLLRLLRCGAPLQGARQRLSRGVLGGLPDREKSLQRVWTGH